MIFSVTLLRPRTLVIITSESGILITWSSSETSASGTPHREHHLLFFQLIYLLWRFHFGISLVLSGFPVHVPYNFLHCQLHPHFHFFPVFGSRSITGISPLQAPTRPLVLASCFSLTWLILKSSPTICLLQSSTDIAE